MTEFGRPHVDERHNQLSEQRRVIGLFIGIEMIFNGWSLVMLGLAAKNLFDNPQA